jgi:hypothetical protein
MMKLILVNLKWIQSKENCLSWITEG